MLWKIFSRILAGRRIWLEIKKRYDVDDGLYVILMPEDDRELNGQALAHIADLIAHCRAKGVVILTADAWVKEKAAPGTKGVIDVLHFSPEEADGLMSYYEFYRFTERLRIVSLTRPNGNKAWRAVGLNGVTIEDIVCLGLYGLRDWPERNSLING